MGKCKKFFNVRVRKFHFPDISGLGLKGFVPRNIWSFFMVSVSWNIRNFFFGVFVSWIFSVLQLRSSISWNTRNFFSGWIFFIFSSLGWKGWGAFLRKYKKLFNLRVRKFHFPKYKEFFSGRIFLFWGTWAEKCAR